MTDNTPTQLPSPLTAQPSIDPLTNMVVTPAAFVAPWDARNIYWYLVGTSYPDARAIGVLRFNAYAIGYNDAIRVTRSEFTPSQCLPAQDEWLNGYLKVDLTFQRNFQPGVSEIQNLAEIQPCPVEKEIS